jgi:cytochrome c6
MDAICHHSAQQITKENVMSLSKRRMMWLWLCWIMLFVGCRENQRNAAEKTDATGEALFQQYCAMCHPDGSNILYPQKTLQRGALAANGITTAEGIIGKMRNPGPKMRRFDSSELSETDARKIAEYVLNKYK